MMRKIIPTAPRPRAIRGRASRSRRIPPLSAN